MNTTNNRNKFRSYMFKGIIIVCLFQFSKKNIRESERKNSSKIRKYTLLLFFLIFSFINFIKKISVEIEVSIMKPLNSSMVKNVCCLWFSLHWILQIIIFILTPEVLHTSYQYLNVLRGILTSKFPPPPSPFNVSCACDCIHICII